MKKEVLIKLIILFIINGTLYFLTIPKLSFKLLGNDKITLEYKQEYQEDGFKVQACMPFKCIDLNDKVKISNAVNNDKLGNYTITYNLDIKGKLYQKTRYINIVDTEKPVITLTGNDKIYLSKNSQYKDLDVIAIDNYDGDITDNIEINNNINTKEIGTYNVTYMVKDSSNNQETIKRNIIVYDSSNKDSLQNEEISSKITEIENYIKNKKLNISLLYYNINNNYTYSYKPNKSYYGCSLIKVLDAMYVYEKMNVTNKLKNLVKPTIERSNNDTHISLVNIIGMSKLRNYGKSLGAKDVLTTGDYYGNTNVNDQLSYMKHLYYLVNNLSNGNELKKYFINNYNQYLSFKGSPTIMHKYGKITGQYYHESGIVLDNNPYIIIILTQEQKRSYVVTELSKKIYELHHLIK